MENVVLTNLTIGELQSLIDSSVSSAMEEKIAALISNVREEEDQLMTKVEVAKLLQVTHGTVHNWKESGLIPYHKISNRIYYKKSEVLAAMKKFNLGRI
jgi:hypothetical protein